jgi:hypothetical protein
MFPHDPRTRGIRTKSKEVAWVSAILQECPGSNWVWDKPIYVDFSGGCCSTKRRIDLRSLVEHKEKGLFWLCIEIDENQHKSRAATYEDTRYNDLFVDFSGRYIFLRVNPDPFRYRGCRSNPPFDQRFQIIKDKIVDLINGGPESTDLVEVHHFFYDS